MNRKRVRGLLQIAISALLLALILRQIHWSEVREALWRMDWRWLALAWGLFLLGVVVRAVRWQVLLDALGVRRPLGELTAWYFVGSFFNVLLPTGFGGDAVRVVELAQDTSTGTVGDRPEQRTDRTSPARRSPQLVEDCHFVGTFSPAAAPRPAWATVLNSVLVDRYVGIMVLLAMGLVAGLARPGAAPSAVLGLTAGLFAGGLLVAWLLRRPWWPRWGQRADAWGRWARRLHLPALAEAVAPYDRRAVSRALAVSLAFNLLQIGWNVAIAQGLGLHVPLVNFLVFVPLTAVALLLPAFGGLGVRELTYVGLFGSAGVPQATALALSLGVYIITVATGLVGGMIYLFQGLRRVARRRTTNDQ